MVFVTHSDKIPPASTLTFTPLLPEPLLRALLIIIAIAIKGTKQKHTNVNLYSYIHPRIIPSIKVQVHWAVEPKVDIIKLCNCMVSMDRRVNNAPGAFLVIS